MSIISIRPITKEDLPALQNIGQVTFSETFDGLNTPSNMMKYLNDKFNLKQLISEFENEKSQFFFAEKDGETIGYLKVNIGDAQTENVLKDALEIERIYVLKSYHGKNVGKLLFDKAVAIAKEKKISEIWLGVWENNFRAVKFYEKHGFEKFNTHIFRLGNSEQTDFLMKLLLE